MKTLRRATVLFLTLLLLAAPVRAAAPVFSDVPSAHWAYESILRATRLGLVSGADGKFGLGRQVTRAEYATMLCRLMGWELIAPEAGSFDDNQDAAKWYYSAVETAYAHGALLKLDEEIGVDEPLPREEMAAMTVRALGYAGLAGVVQDDCPFDDVTTNRGYIALAYRMGLIGGMGTLSYAPRTPSTREQAATVLLRVYDKLRAEIEASALPEGASGVYAAPLTGAQTPVPMCPRAPLESVYEAAIQAGRGGTVVLHTAPYDATNGRTLARPELNALLADGATEAYRSARYGSSYLVAGDGAVVWYESAEDIAEKTALCRLLGAGAVYLTE